MKTYQIILLTITIFIFLYVLWRFFKRRRDINRLSHKLHIEGLKNKPRCKNALCGNNDIDRIEEFGSPESEYKGLIDETPTKIMSISKEYTNRPLKEYVIKSSYNSAITGNYVNTNMITNVLHRGCRFLDLEVLYINEKPFVTHTTDNKFETINTDNKVLLDNILMTAVSRAFTQPSPNYKDPLFIHLRLKSNNKAIYKAVAKSIDATLRSRLYPKKITEKTLLSDIMGKIVIIMDKTLNRKYVTDSTCPVNDKNCMKLFSYINMESGSDILYHNTYTDIANQSYNIVQIKDKCAICTDVNHYRLVVPDKLTNTNNPNSHELIGKHGCQLVTNRFYIKDDNLRQYEKLFDDNKGGIVPLAFVLDYLKKEEGKMI
jgi:hypothetical protein